MMLLDEMQVGSASMAGGLVELWEVLVGVADEMVPFQLSSWVRLF